MAPAPSSVPALKEERKTSLSSIPPNLSLPLRGNLFFPSLCFFLGCSFSFPLTRPSSSEERKPSSTVSLAMANLMDKAKGFLAEKVAHMKKPEAELSDVDLSHVSRDSATFLSKVDVTNPYGHDLPICEISYTFKSAGRVVASGTLPDPGSLKANDKTRVDVPLKVPYDFLISIMRDVGRDWDIDYELQVGLTIDLPIFGNFTIPLSKKGEAKLPTLSDIF